jgi:TIR domain
MDSKRELTIFFSYASADNEAPPFEDGAAGFVTFLHQQLSWELANLGEPKTVFWFDRERLNLGDSFQNITRDAINGSSVLLVVLSPNWAASEWCQKVLEIFVTRWKADEDVSRRIFVVQKSPVDQERLPLLLRDRVHFAFFASGDTGGVTAVYEFYWRGVRDKQRYFEVLTQLARSLYDWAHDPAEARPKNGPVKRRKDSASGSLPPAPSTTSQAPVIFKEPDPTTEDRTKPEYWLHRVSAYHQLSAGDQPIVLVSFASEDQTWIDDLHAFLEPRIGELRDSDGQPYRLWNFSDAKVGTTPGDEFPEIVAEKMWRCRAAVIVLSRDYFRSTYCRYIELPFLLWRWEHHKLMCLPVKLGIVPIDKVRLPRYEGVSRSVVLNDIIDDRQAAIDFSSSPHRDFNLKELKESGLEAEIEKRFDGISRRIEDFLKRRYNARDED